MRNTGFMSLAAATFLLAGCGAASSGPIPFDIGESEGCYQNPNWTPPEFRRPPAPAGSGIQLSPIPGESGFSNTSSCLSGRSGHGAGHR